MLNNYTPGPRENRIFDQNLSYEEEFERAKRNGFAKEIKAAMFEIGVPPRTQKATCESVPKEIANLNCHNNFPATNYGLDGLGGCGKSCSLAYGIKRTLLKEMSEAGPKVIREEPPSIPGLSSTPRLVSPHRPTVFKWVGWPAMASRMKGLAARREWLDPLATVAALASWATSNPEHHVLILDDIGEEGVKAESYVSEQLELLIDELYNFECRMFWTSNHTVEALAESSCYGYRLASRLVGLSPDVHLPEGMPDLRVVVAK